MYCKHVTVWSELFYCNCKEKILGLFFKQFRHCDWQSIFDIIDILDICCFPLIVWCNRVRVEHCQRCKTSRFKHIEMHLIILTHRSWTARKLCFWWVLYFWKYKASQQLLGQHPPCCSVLIGQGFSRGDHKETVPQTACFHSVCSFSAARACRDGVMIFLHMQHRKGFKLDPYLKVSKRKSVQ